MKFPPWSVVLAKIVLMLYLGGICEQYMVWCWFYEPRQRCIHEALPANHTGVKVLAAGIAKTGTSSMTEAFNTVGIKQSYHGPDFLMHVHRPLMDDFWRRPENGGNGDPTSIATVRAPAMLSRVDRTTTSVKDSLAKTPAQDIAFWLSKCRVEAMTFDGHERVFWPVSDTSPGAKYVVLSWRTYQEWEKSYNSFAMKSLISIHALAFLLNGVHLMPWGVFLIPGLDTMSGGAIDNFLRNGRPYTSPESKGVAVKFLMNIINNRWIFSPHLSGIMEFPDNEEQYYAWYEEVRKRIPAKQRMEWNVKKNNLKDLCNFLEIKGHPGCELPMPRVTLEIMRTQFDEPLCFAFMSACYIMIHIVNYKIVWGVIGWLMRLLAKSRKTKEA